MRKPWHAGTPAVIGFMAAVRSAGLDVPAVLGRDQQGGLMLGFVPGELAMRVALPAAVAQRACAGAVYVIAYARYQ